MKRLALSSFLICGGRDDGYGGMLLRLAGELLLLYYAAEGDWRRPASQVLYQGDWT